MMWEFLRILCLFVLPVFAVAVLLIWDAGGSSKPARSQTDRIAWTIFALGICLMFGMAVYAMALEGDGHFRSWELIRAHKRWFLAIAVISVAGPLIVFLHQAIRGHGPRSSGKRPPI